MTLILTSIFLLALWDVWFTLDQFKRFGTKVEINKLILWLTKHVGAAQGVLVGILVPTLSGIALLATQEMEKTACVWLGMRLCLALHQLKFKISFQKKVELLSNKRD